MSAKILKVVFVILLLVTIGELGYYVYVLKGNKSIDEKISQTREVELAPATASPGETEYLISEAALNYLKSRPKNKGSKYYLIGEEVGIIGEIRDDEEKGQFVFRIDDSEGNRIVT